MPWAGREEPGQRRGRDAHGGFHLVARAVQFETDNADFVGHVGLADVGDDLELATDFPHERLLDELGREHQPQSLLGWSR